MGQLIYFHWGHTQKQRVAIRIECYVARSTVEVRSVDIRIAHGRRVESLLRTLR